MKCFVTALACQLVCDGCSFGHGMVVVFISIFVLRKESLVVNEYLFPAGDHSV